jgi:hypothetical protein
VRGVADSGAAGLGVRVVCVDADAEQPLGRHTNVCPERVGEDIRAGADDDE